jgi:hypothetical protein
LSLKIKIPAVPGRPDGQWTPYAAVAVGLSELGVTIEDEPF